MQINVSCKHYSLQKLKWCGNMTTNPFVDDEKLAAMLELCRSELVFLNVAS